MTLFLTVLLAAAPAQMSDPALLAVQSFYTAYARNKFDGLPAKEQFVKVRPLVSKPLANAIRIAQARQAACIRKNPDEKGPWVEGDMFSSNFEGFTSFHVIEQPASSGLTRREFVVEFEYRENGHTFLWRDKAVASLESGRWVLDDVIYRQQEGFSSGFGSNLKNALNTDPGCS